MIIDHTAGWMITQFDIAFFDYKSTNQSTSLDSWLGLVCNPGDDNLNVHC